MLNSRTHLFVATASGSESKSLHPNAAPLLPKLRGQFAEFLNVGFSRAPEASRLTYLCRFTVRAPCRQRLGAFLVSVVTVNLPIRRSALLRLSGYMCDHLIRTPYGIRPTYSAVGSPDVLRPSITQARWYWNINQLSIDYAFRPRLRVRLTPGGRTFPGNP